MVIRLLSMSECCPFARIWRPNCTVNRPKVSINTIYSQLRDRSVNRSVNRSGFLTVNAPSIECLTAEPEEAKQARTDNEWPIEQPGWPG